MDILFFPIIFIIPVTLVPFINNKYATLCFFFNQLFYLEAGILQSQANSFFCKLPSPYIGITSFYESSIKILQVNIK